MTDDLIKRLREGARDTGVIIATAAEVNTRMHDAAERIEELERELEIRGGVLESWAVQNPEPLFRAARRPKP